MVPLDYWDSDPTVFQILDDWPETIPAFNGLGMLCAGCPAARFHSLSQACLDHGIQRGAVVARLEGAIRSGSR